MNVVSCTKYTYRCQNGLCLSKGNPECDGKEDCSDGSDEKNCGKQGGCAWWARVFIVQHLGEHPGVEILLEPHSRSPVPTQRAHLSGRKKGFAPWHKHSSVGSQHVSISGTWLTYWLLHRQTDSHG